MYAKCGDLLDARQVFDTMPEHDMCSWSTLFSAYSKQQKSKEVIYLYYKMQHTGIEPNGYIFVAILKACANLADLEQGKKAHEHINKSGFCSDIFVGNTIVAMYAKCGNILDARRVFDRMCDRDVVSWNVMITGYVQHAHGNEGFALFEQMQQEGWRPDSITFLSILKVCASLTDLNQGKQIHAQVIESGFESDIFVASTLVDMYAKCGSMEDARQVFNKMHERNVVSWNAIIAGYAQQGHGEEALMLFDRMQDDGVRPDGITFACILKACASTAALERGKQVHAQIIKSGIESNCFVGSALVDMYAKCGCIEDARLVFNRMPERDVVSWTALISGYVQHGHKKMAYALFERMQFDGVYPDNVTFISILKACASLRQGRELHAYVIKYGFGADVSVGSTLIDMYAKCGSIQDARMVFNGMHKRDVVSWTAMIAGYAEQGQGEEALTLFKQMQGEGVKPNNVTFSSILKACGSISALEHGKQIHALVVESGFELDAFVGSSLVDMYAKCGKLEDARRVFDEMCNRDAVLWTAMIAGYAQQGHGEEALVLFDQMQREGMEPNSVTFASILKACASLAALEQGKEIHSLAIETGLESNIFVASALVDMYAKCGCIDDACKVFNRMHERDAVAWTAMISAFAQQGQDEEALILFEEMQLTRVKPDGITFTSIVKACTNLATLERGKQVHALVIENDFESVLSVGNALIGMYAKCGSIDDAFQVFVRMPDRDAVSWNAIIAAYAQQGHGKETLTLFEQMQQNGIKPDEITFVSVLSACSHKGLVNDGHHCFNFMSQVHGISPTMEHFACIVDLLGRAGCLDEAEDFINKMPVQPSAVVWMALLGACRNHGNIELGRFAFESVSKLEANYAGAYVLLSNIYAAAGRWDEVAEVRKWMEDAWCEGAWMQLDCDQ